VLGINYVLFMFFIPIVIPLASVVFPFSSLLLKLRSSSLLNLSSDGNCFSALIILISLSLSSIQMLSTSLYSAEFIHIIVHLFVVMRVIICNCNTISD